MWIKPETHHSNLYPFKEPKWHFVKEYKDHVAHTACGLHLSTVLYAASQIRDNVSTRKIMCKKCRKATDGQV